MLNLGESGQIFANLANSRHILPNLAKLRYLVKYCTILSNLAKSCKILQMWLNLAKNCEIVWTWRRKWDALVGGTAMSRSLSGTCAMDPPSKMVRRCDKKGLRCWLIKTNKLHRYRRLWGPPCHWVPIHLSPLWRPAAYVLWPIPGSGIWARRIW